MILLAIRGSLIILPTLEGSHANHSDTHSCVCHQFHCKIGWNEKWKHAVCHEEEFQTKASVIRTAQTKLQEKGHHLKQYEQQRREPLAIDCQG